MDILDNLKMAVSALLANKLRSSLTMLGITIGNASVIGMVAIGQGAQKLAAEQFQALGPNVLFVSLTSARVRRTASAKAKPLLLEDAQAIARLVPTVAEVAPEIQANQLIAKGKQMFNSPIIGTTGEFLRVRNHQLVQGRFINEVDNKRMNRVVVLGPEISQRLFPEENPIGQQVRIKNISFEVIGILAPKGSLFDSNQDNKAIVPLTTALYQLTGRTSPHGIPVTLISILAKNQESVKGAEFQIKNLLHLLHPTTADDDILISSQNAILETADETNEGLTRMLAAIASVSLLVGGIGVMNIMLVSVTERTQEIGLRKALGATQKDILLQFLIEAVLLAILGGLIGVGVGVGGVTIASMVSSLATSISIPSIVISLSVSGGIGLFFGVFPAKRAAQLNPIIALRSS
ncbi:ABC transporter permease [Aphanothece sacrum]|uniref:ABC transporter permease protein n=1 Tax=Aphanothece sacrum FPU1 TaxID=1920663 RepID=A0A401ID10_APHSA|nr:ABC transporter permease [Aphanothece sacrum]GBF79165.1 hypothetical protein AsFPU1_0557 [Aphanothece sacrum FPU1]GBF86554.1 hypothetical protein AsFPU3_3625 [Aphanothece sacrum FPU3]